MRRRTLLGGARTVTAGQTLTVLVEGFGPDATGPYTLTAELLP